jgi:hypothetical protein
LINSGDVVPSVNLSVTVFAPPRARAERCFTLRVVLAPGAATTSVVVAVEMTVGVAPSVIVPEALSTNEARTSRATAALVTICSLLVVDASSSIRAPPYVSRT